MMNATLPPSKRSRVEREMDWLILFMFALLLAMCIIGAVAYSVWTHHLSPDQWSDPPHMTIPLSTALIHAYLRVMMRCCSTVKVSCMPAWDRF